MKVPVAPALHQHLALSLFWVLPILIDVYLIIVQICISLMIYDVKHLVMFTTCVHFCEAAINVSLAHFFIRLIIFVQLSFIAAASSVICLNISFKIRVTWWLEKEMATHFSILA